MRLHFHTSNNEYIYKVNQFINVWNNELDFFETQTSGSTGTPKTIKIKKEFAINSAKATLDYFNIDIGQNALLALNIDTIGGKMMVVRSIVGNLNLYVVEPKSNPLEHFEKKVDFLAIAPIQLARMFDYDPDRLKQIKTVIVGGGIISNELVHKLNEAKIGVFQTFGMTETISHIAIRKVGYEGEETYKTLGGIEIDTLDNQLIIHAPNIGLTGFKTNDSIEKINKTTFIWKGRIDFVINSGGIKFIPEELEAELVKHLNLPFFVLGIPDKLLGEKILLVLEGEKNQKLESKPFYKFLKNSFSIPKEIAFLDKFCYTKSAKIDKLKTLQKVNAIGTKKVL